MSSQTLVAVVLPHGRTTAGRLRLAVHVSPRLSGAQLLSDFPDWLTWTDLIRQHGLRITLTSGGRTRTVAVDTSVLRPDVWDAVFSHDSLVEEFPVTDYDERLVVSYPSRQAHAFVQWAWRLQAARPVSTGERQGLLALLDDLVFRDQGGASTLDETLAQRRVTLWQEQHGEPGSTGTAERPPSEMGAFTPDPLAKPPQTREMAEQMALYHHLPAAPGRAPLPHSAAALVKLIDFHRALASLTSYPTLLPALGLSFDLELPAAFCPDSPAGGTYLEVQVTDVLPGWAWSNAPTLVTPATSYVRSAKEFAAAPATSPADLAGGVVAASDVVDGFLALTPDDFHIVGVDVDGAMLKAMALADSLVVAGANDPSDPALPALRSGGLSLLADGRAQQLLQAIRDNQGFNDAVTGGSMRPLTARDVTRGYRLDVYDDRSGTWRSLHRRDGTYRFGRAGLIVQTEDEEGFVQLAVTQPADDPTRPEDPVATAAGIPQPGADLYVNERVARWNGWSLSAPRPGQPLNRSPDPARALENDPTAGTSVTTFHVETRFAAHAGSLPALRFGRRYRLRARAVDLGGHSVDLATAAPGHLVAPPDGQLLPYFRFEPVGPPTVVLRSLPGPGGSLLEMVIRSHNTSPALDQAPTYDADERHLAPPRAAVLQVEHHGMLDDPTGRLRGDAATYAMLTARDNATIPSVGNDPLEPGPALAVPYLADPIARGVALTDLPQTPGDTDGSVIAGSLSYAVLPGADPRPGSVTHLSFGPDWPARRSLRLRLVEGKTPPSWDDAERLLTVSLPKAATTTTALSSFLDAEDLDLLGVWDWLRGLFELADAAALADPAAGTELVELASTRGEVTRRTLEGGNPMITPAERVTLTHAVQQPLGLPTFTRLPIVHDAASPIVAASLANAFTPITAWRSLGSHHAVLLGALQINAASTGAIDIEARWIDWLDDLDHPGPTTRQGSGYVERINLPDGVSGEVAADGTGVRSVAVYLPGTDALWFAAPFDSLDGVSSPSSVAAPVHQLDDTLHRTIRYRAVASSRFAEYFTEPGTVTSRAGPFVTVNVPSSARPLPPDIAYVVPTFGWVREVTTNTKTDVRRGNGLRVYLHRPWYSSGAAELLGVVTWPATDAPPDDDQREAAKGLITQWGLDPIWSTGPLGAIPGVFQLPLATHTGRSLTLDNTPQLVDVAGHRPGYDEERRLWYCDIELEETGSYMPFVRLALARYQPRSIDGVELSEVVLADFAQLTPDRSAALTVDPADPLAARLVVGGLAPSGPTRSLIVVTVEERRPHVAGDLGWAAAPPATVSVQEDAPAPSQPEAVLFSGTVRFTKRPAPGQFRVAIREFEILPIDPPMVALDDSQDLGSRLVYASILELDYPLRLFPA